MPRALRFKQRLDRYPPILIRLCATRGRYPNERALTDQQIADACGLTMAEVKRVSYSTDWDQIPIATAYRFLTGCDIDIERRKTLRRLEWRRRFGGFRYLRKSPLFDSQFVEMLDLWTGRESA